MRSHSSALDRLASDRPTLNGRAFHVGELVHGVHERARDVADVNVVALEVRLEQHHEAVIHRPVDEIVHQEIDAHARRHAEHGGEPQADRILPIEDDLFRRDLVAAVERDRTQR